MKNFINFVFYAVLAYFICQCWQATLAFKDYADKQEAQYGK